MIKRLVSVLCVTILLITLTACKSDNVGIPFDKKAESKMLEDTLVAQNDNFILECNSKNYGVVLKNIKTGEVWGTSPPEETEVELDEFGLPKERSYQVESVFLLKYLEYASNTEVTAFSYDAVTNGRVRCEKIENGLRVEYYLDSIEIMIPVEYILYEDYVSISVDPKQIQENNNKVVKLSLAPYWCSVKNDSQDSYLFVPSGQGAIVTPETRSEPIKTFSASVYGQDYTMEKAAEVSSAHDVLLPVIGSKWGNTATCAIIDNGAESAEVYVDSGDSMIGYCAVYTTFCMRGYTYHSSKLFSSNEVNSTIYADKMHETPVSVRYYPISGDKANYSGMASVYRDYLIKEYGMTDKKSDTALNLTVVGGTMITESVLGVPYDTLYPATTLSQAYDIISDLSSEIDTEFSVKLKGFGNTGVDVGDIGGKFQIANELGNTKDLAKISEICEALYMDFEVLRYSSASNGFSPSTDSVMNPGKQKAYQYNYDLAVGSKIEDSLYYLLSPELIPEAVSKLTDKTEDWKISGISLETLSNMLYSDYSDKGSSKYYVRSGLRDIAVKALKTAKAGNKKLMSTKANDYAAALSDLITDAPLASTGAYVFEYDVPFYQMVFKGYVPMVGESVNLAAESDDLILRAVESGCGLNFTVSNGWDKTLIDAESLYFYNSGYYDLKEEIVSTVTELSDYYGKISSAHILSHRVLADGVRETVFDNGITVYVNYTDEVFTVADKEIAPHDFLVLESVI